MKRIKEKIVICFVVIMMMVTQMPSGQMINAQDTGMFSVLVNDIDTDSKSIEVMDISETITRIDLSLGGEIMDSQETGGNLSFDVYINGDYTIIGYDESDAQVSEESVTINDFEYLTIEKDENHDVRIVSRYPLTSEIIVNGTETIGMDNTGYGYYEGSYTIPKNGDYTFVVMNLGGDELSSTTMTFTDLPEVEEPEIDDPETGLPEVPGDGTEKPEEPGVEDPEAGLPEEGVPGAGLPEENLPIINEMGEIVLSSEADFIHLLNNPTASFILMNNIELTSDVLSEVTFSGTLNGNGYMMSGFADSLFNSVENATINNVLLQGALAKTSINSTINDSGFYVEASDESQDIAVILNSEDTTINNSFALMNVEGKNVSSFILNGTGIINNSYVSGYLKGEEVVGFGQEVKIKNSYINASLVGEDRTLFTNLSDGVSEDSFYDVRINDLEDKYATPMYTEDLISDEFINDEFTIIDGQYPQIKNIQLMNELAQDVSTLSVLSVKTDSNLSALEGIVETEEKEEIVWDESIDEVRANRSAFVNRFALKQAEPRAIVSAGNATTAKTTQVSFPITMGNYYKALKTSEGQPANPTSSVEAKDTDWKIMYWSGNYKEAGLEWNTEYTIYCTNLTTLTPVGTVYTEFGKNGGKLVLTGTYDVGEEMTATLSGTNTNKGTLYWETVATLTIGAAAAKEVKTTTMDGSTDVDTYTVQANDIGNNYLRVRFVADDTTGYQGTLTDATINIIKEDITNVTIENKTSLSDKFTLGDQLVANMQPAGYENEVIFKWFHEGDSVEDEPIAVGRNYEIVGNDIGKQIFVRAVVKEEGRFKESKNSDPTTIIEGIQAEQPLITDMDVIGKDDITITLLMDVTEGLYRYGYSTANSIDNLTIHPVLSRNQTETTIIGLTPNTDYYFYVQRVGENGYGDSEWSTDYLKVTTNKEHVKGDVLISGNTIYNQTLTASINNNSINQTGQFVWYRLDGNGQRDGSALATNVSTYKLIKEDIGKKLEVAYEGTNNYAGEITTISDIINKEEKTAPTTNLAVTAFDDTTITVKMPTNAEGEKYILGVSNTASGVPIERLDNNVVKEFSSGDTYKITGLDRDTEYFLYVRYAENETHYKSDWIVSTSVVQQRTQLKAFSGSISFNYETTGKLMRGQTLTANLNTTDTSFNYKGEWKWSKVIAGQATEITNFTLTNNKQGTQYVVPTDEAIGVTYKVTFTANLGYTGSVTATSTAVQDIVKEKYTKPEASNIAMEAIDDSSFKVKMDSGEGKYRFWYKEKDATPWDSIRGFFNKAFVDPNDGYKEVRATTGTGVDVIANVDVVISGLPRNTEYIVRVQRVEDDKGLASDFVYSTDKASEQSVRTMKTEIAGNVTIEGTTRYNETLTATYNQASYASTGTGADIEGTWQWYRGTIQIPSATSKTYKLVQADINQVLTAKYTMPANHSFTGTVEAKTATIQKAMGVSPTITGIVSGVINNKMTMTVTGTLGAGGTDNVYYRLQKASASVPTIVPTLGATIPTGWYKVTNPTISIDKDCDNLVLEANTEYTIYFIKTATVTEESTSLLSKTYKMGTFQQDGTITFSKLADTAKQAFVVGQTVKANLASTNLKGKWKWFKSKNVYNGTTITTPPASTAGADWEEITSGFSQTSDNKISELNLSEDLFAHFIRAEFVADGESGYSGSISSTENQYVRKIYDEKLKIESSTKDGNGNPKAYANTTLTATVENYAESGDLDRTTVQFKYGNNVITSSPTKKDNTFTYKLGNVSSYDGQEITAVISAPKKYQLYVDKDLKSINSATTLKSDESTQTSMLYTSGVPISNLTDLENFMKRASGYDDYTVTAKFVLTDDIDMSASNFFYGADWHYFQGVFDGDYHIISGLKTYLFHYICNKDFKEGKTTDAGSATVKNLIILNSDVDVGGSAGTLARTSITNLTVERVMSLDSRIKSTMYAGLLMGRSDTLSNRSSNYKLTISEVMSAGGKVSSTNDPSNGNDNGAGALVGGISIPTVVSNVSTVSTSVTSKYRTGGIIGNVDKHSTFTSPDILNMNRVLVASTLSGTISDIGPVIGKKVNGNIIKNAVFYDSTIYPDTSNEYGNPLPTNNLIGTSIVGVFGIKWVYNGGYYPRLAWLKDNPMAILYTATRGAFTSPKGDTNLTDLLNGNIKGSIQIPAELQTQDFSVSSSDSTILKVTNSGTIIPVGSAGEKAIITITYTKPNTSVKAIVKNTFEFTIAGRISEMSAVSIVDHTTGLALSDAPTMNQVLRASSTQGTSWQWYRRKSGSTTKEMISNATAQTYQVKSSDVGYEISVLVGANGYASTYSDYTKAAVSIIPNAPNVSSITDSSVKLNANGNSTFKYEFGYVRADQNALITQVEGTYTYNENATVNNLQRNKKYKFYTRIVAGPNGSYPASDWSLSTIGTTYKTMLTGKPQLGTAINNGEKLTLNMENINGQTGTWLLERWNAAGTSKVADIAFTSSNNSAEYTLTTADVGNRIKAHFKGNGDFEGSIASELSKVIQKSMSLPPAQPTLSANPSPTDTTVVLNTPGIYDIAYAKSTNGEKVIVRSDVNVSQGPSIKVNVTGLEVNTDYYFFIRNSETSGSVASPWSAYTYQKTSKVSMNNKVTDIGYPDRIKVNDDVTFTAPTVRVNSSTTVVPTGTWKLERVNSATSTTTISPLNYQVANNQLIYEVAPRDGGYKFKVTFIGNGDFEGSTSIETQNETLLAYQNEDILSNDVEVSEIKDHSLKVKITRGQDTYQFLYALEGDIFSTMDVPATVRAGTNVLIEGLKRNTRYTISAFKAPKMGYEASLVQEVGTFKTDKTTLTGTVEYVKIENGSEVAAKVGIAEVNATYKAKYISGKYAQAGVDTAGHWQWYADGNPISGATSDTYTIEPMINVDEITVRFIANEASDFKGYRSASIGTLTKPAYGPPSVLPTVTALVEDGSTGSKLKISSNEVDNVFYYVQKAENTNVPTTILASTAENNEVKENQWFKATSDMTLNLEANTEYVVYVARLEDGSHLSSGVISQRPVKTAKDDISKIDNIVIAEADTGIKWKVLQEKELRINRDGKPVEGVWQYYVTQTKETETSWQNVTSEVKANTREGNTTTDTFTKVNVPLKYANGYYFRAVFIGRGDLEGSRIYTSSEALIGTQLKGKAELTTGNTSEVFVPIKANYVIDIADEQNGIWTWYRKLSITSIPEIIKTGTVGIIDSYTPTADDVGKQIYAVYKSAAEGIYSGSVTSAVLTSVQRATQIKPEAITLKQINGTSIEINLPNNMLTTGKTIAQPRLEYKAKGETTWIENNAGDAWIHDLKANTEYHIRAIFEGTSEYLPSVVSETLTVKTGNQLFDVDKLTINEPNLLENGKEITATYSGDGYDEGHFVIKRSDGTTINSNVIPIVSRGFLFFSSGSTSMKYTITDGDIGSNIVIQFVANTGASTYGGSIEKSTKEVVKADSVETAAQPTLEQVKFSETELKGKVVDANEYVLNESVDVVDVNSSAWSKLTKDADDYHIFTGLDKSKSYYLHTRIAETANKGISLEAVSTSLKPWASQTYTITYEGMLGATHSNPNNFTELTPEIMLADATKKGYTFDGWTTNTITKPTKGLTITVNSSGNKTFTANWTINQYTATFDSNGGSNVSSITKDYSTELGTLPTSTKEGYTFDGWFTAVTGGTEVTASTTMPADNVTYYARWTINQYTATFDSNGGKESEQKINKNFQEKLGELPKVTRIGYTFEGWFTAATGGTKITADTLMPLNGTTYYAQWTITNYTITYELDGGSLSNTNLAKYTVDTDTFTLNNPTKEGHTFIGWKLNGETTSQTNVIIQKGSTGDRNYTAIWEINKFDVIFETNGGTSITNQVIDWSGKISKPTNPKKTGYTFVGWYKEGAFTNLWDFDKDTVTKKETLYAKFIETLGKVTASVDPSVILNKGDTVELYAVEGATIYYTVDGSEPSTSSTQYTGAFTLNNTVTIKAIAVKVDYANSEVATFEFKVIGKSIITKPDENSLLQVKNPDDEILKAVLTVEEYKNYLSGTDAAVRIDFKEITGTLTDIITNALAGRTVGNYFEINIYKKIGSGSETAVTKLTNKLQLIINIPLSLYPPSGTTRTFDVMRIHNNTATILPDLDQDNKTVTIESDEFSEYILCYKDKKENPPVNPDRPSKPDKPIEPEKPVEPENPVDPDAPVVPEKPVEPGEPSNPDTPVTPEQPIDPEKPILPDTPVIGGDTDDLKPEEPKDDESVDQGGTTVKPGPDGEKPIIKPDGTIDVPNGGGTTVGGNDFILPDGGTVNKDGSITIPKDGKIEINGNTIEIPQGGTIETDGSISVKAGSTVLINGEEVYFEKDGTIKPDGTYSEAKNEEGTFSVKDVVLSLWMLMYIGGFVALFKKKKERK